MTKPACGGNPDLCFIAEQDDGSCEYPAEGFDCAGACLEDYLELTLPILTVTAGMETF